MRVLIVDDEPRYRVYLRAKLDREGHEVVVAENGREAIGRGIGFRPNVLVSDWMLRNHVHGLAVSDALRAVDPQLGTILMTGFSSRDLRSQARDASIFQFLEKPFDLSELAAAVDRVGWTKLPRSRTPFGVLVFDREGLVVHLNEHAQRMLAATVAGPGLRRLDEILTPEAQAQLETPSDDEWIYAAPIADRRVRWWVRAKRWGDGGILVMLPERRKFLRGDPRVRLLLDLPPPRAAARIPDTKVLVIDAAPIQETRYVDQFERVGSVCYKAESPELGLRLFGEDPQIGVVVIASDTAGAGLLGLVDELRRLRPGAELVGMSPRLQDEVVFAALGVSRFLHAPWRIGDLLQVLEEEHGRHSPPASPGPGSGGRGESSET